MVQATWNGEILAESNDTIVVEGNHYFPPESIRAEFFTPSDTTSICGWKGKANYHSLKVNGAENPDAAWYYADPKPEAGKVRGRIAFWKGVKVG